MNHDAEVQRLRGLLGESLRLLEFDFECCDFGPAYAKACSDLNKLKKEIRKELRKQKQQQLEH